jgi:murein DD-endopeptidase MepM/ murein hydrolase activator NlpD
MVNPVPGYKVTTGYGKRGKHWSCSKTSAGGIHTGVDLGCPKGTPVVAARAGTVKHTTYGAAFGAKQFAIFCADGSSDFYAHTLDRPANGAKVKAGEKVAKAGDLGNVTASHLHFERHKKAGSWSCSNVVDPSPSINAGVSAPPVVAPGAVYVSKLVFNQSDSDSVARMQTALNKIKLVGGANLPMTGGYFAQTRNEVAKWQDQKAADKTITDGSRVTFEQARELFNGTGNTLIDDVTVTPPPAPEVPVSARIIYHYSGKPSKTQEIGTAYTTVTDSKWKAPGAGWCWLMCYANISHVPLKVGGTGGIRSRAVRESPTDETAYQDHAVVPGMVASGSFLLQRTWFGAIQKGRPMRWDIRRSKSLGKTVANTRYVKSLWISADLAAAPSVGRSTAPPQPARHAPSRLLRWLALRVLLFWAAAIFGRRIGKLPAKRLVSSLVAAVEANPELLARVTAQTRALIAVAVKDGKKPRTAVIEW